MSIVTDCISFGDQDPLNFNDDDDDKVPNLH